MRTFYALTLATLLCLGCASLNKSATAQHNLRLANADLAAALNRVETVALQANQAGAITVEETIKVSQVVTNATYLSDGIEGCIDNAPKQGTISGCIAPLLAQIQQNMTLSALGIKSAGATATFTAALASVTVALQEITAKEQGQ